MNTETKYQEMSISELIEELGGDDGRKREKARAALVKKGKDSIKPLKKQLDHPKHLYRWEVMMALKDIAGEELIPLFIKKLYDEEGDIRWIAAEGLIQEGAKAVNPILKALLEDTESVFLLAGTHHIFRELHNNKKLPDSFPYVKIMPLLRSTSLSSSLKVLVYEILNN